MKQINWIRIVSRWGGVIATILKVFSIIGTVSLLVLILTSAILPRDTFRLLLKEDLSGEINYSQLLGEGWTDQMRSTLREMIPDGQGEVTETSLILKGASQDQTLDNKTIALALIPLFVSLLIAVRLFESLRRALWAMYNSPNAFSREAAGHFRGAGICLIILSIAPSLCSSLIAMLTRVLIGGTSFSFSYLCFGFSLFAIAQLLESGTDRIDPSFSQESSTPPEAF